MVAGVDGGCEGWAGCWTDGWGWGWGCVAVGRGARCVPVSFQSCCGDGVRTGTELRLGGG